jgi:hypothetical protein
LRLRLHCECDDERAMRVMMRAIRVVVNVWFWFFLAWLCCRPFHVTKYLSTRV